MGNLTTMEQVLLAYYINNFLEETDTSMQKLETVLKDSLQDDYEETIISLEQKGLVNKAQEDDKERITNEGILFIDNIIHMQSDANENNKLAYIKDNLLTYEIGFTIEGLKRYVYDQVGIE